MSGKTVLRQEISQQPDALEKILIGADDAVREAAVRIRDFEPEVVLLAARGSSDNAARYAQYLFGAYHGLVVALATPSLFTLYHRPPRLRRTLTIGLSQSGQSPDVVAVIEETRRQGGLTLAITNDPSSPLADASGMCIALGITTEHSVAATQSYTGTLLALAMLSTKMDGDPVRSEALRSVPHAVRNALVQRQLLAAGVRAFAGYNRFLVVGRGYNYCTAFEIALKMKETSYVVAEAHSMADLMHGPMAMVDEQLPAILVAPRGAGSDESRVLLLRLQKLGAKTIVISDGELLLELADLAVPMSHMPEWLSPVIAIVPGQLLALELAIARGCDPDHPRGLSKVTLTF
jgi:glucosamine--fructose-6-phosphate aminotransferase (isomerizing)